jgi:hypothetical protein
MKLSQALKVVEKVLQVGPTVDYSPGSLLQIVLHPFQKWPPNLHMQILPESHVIGSVPKFRMVF